MNLNYFFTAFLLVCIFDKPIGQRFVQFQEDAQINHTFSQVTFNGGGVAFVDLDGDLDDDIYLSGGLDGDRIYINDGNGIFTDITATCGIDSTAGYYTTGVSYGDVDNDGDQDLFVNTYYKNGVVTNRARNLLYINNGDLTFTEVWDSEDFRDKSMCLGSTFIDYDLDGDLDIYTVNYVDVVRFTYDDEGKINGFDHDCFKNYMYRNEGNHQFVEVSAELGLDDTGCALAVTATDYDRDGDLDILVGNDFGPFIRSNRLYRNDYMTLGKFTDVSLETGAGTEMFAMGIAIGDVDNDLLPDYYISNMGKNVLLRQTEGGFVDIAASANVENEFSEPGVSDKLAVSWGSLMCDIDNDMDVDIFVANGYVPAPSFINNSSLDPDRMYINNGAGVFTELDSSAGIYNDLASRGCAYSDIDMDGRLDLFSVVYNKPAFGKDPSSCLFKNVTEGSNNWVKIKLEGTSSNRNGFGSRIYLYAGDDVRMMELSGASSFCSQNSSIIHFGLAQHEMVDSVVVFWPGNRKQIATNLEINTLHLIKEEYISSVPEEIGSEDIKIFPNPATENIIVLSPEKTLRSAQVIGLDGRPLREVFAEQINISELPGGCYILRLEFKDKTIAYRKFIKL